MREIKFRRAHFGFDGKFIQFTEWGKDLNGTSFASPAWISGEEKRLAVDQQYTGLKDRNNKDVFEGDIMTWRKYEGTKHQTRWVVQEGINFTSKSWGSSDKKEDAEIIGNIYENPELLNSEQTDERSVASETK